MLLAHFLWPHLASLGTPGSCVAYLKQVFESRHVDLLVGGAYRWETFAGYYVDWDDSFM